MTPQGLEGVAAASPSSAFLSGPGKWLVPRPTWNHSCVCWQGPWQVRPSFTM